MVQLTDISVVLFRPRWDEVADMFASLATIASEVRTIRVLLSGPQAERDKLETVLGANGLHTRTDVVHRFDNLGFASGHNLLLQRSFRDGAASCLVLNPDVEIRPGALTELLRGAAASPGALLGPTLASRENNRLTVDSLGIEWTSTGRHRDKAQGSPWTITPGRLERVSGITGACLLVQRQAYDAIINVCGYFFDDFFLAYREDAELGLRASLVGVPSLVLHIDGFRHDRHVQGFQRGKVLPDLLGVRNRLLIRWALGCHRPGRAGLATLRDLLVAVSVFAYERRSRPGLAEGLRIRRATRGRGRRAYRNTSARWVLKRHRSHNK